MTERAAKHTWVEVHTIVLAPGERAPHVPADTQQLPLEMQVKGFLLHDAIVGEDAAILTPAGRTLHGTLRAIKPPYTHTYGPPLPALSPIGSEVRAILRARGKVQ
jgi:2-amino-4-ketopentanoate thiolase alpha subunit